MSHPLESRLVSWMGMSHAVWMRHAHPWSFATRVPVLPLLALAIWSRTWWGAWALVPVAALLVWIRLNPRAFPRPRSTRNWASQAVLGERVWLNRQRIAVPHYHRRIPIILEWVSAAGLPFLGWGLWQLALGPTVLGLVLSVGAKLWFCDHMVWLYRDMQEAVPEYWEWLY